MHKQPNIFSGFILSLFKLEQQRVLIGGLKEIVCPQNSQAGVCRNSKEAYPNGWRRACAFRGISNTHSCRKHWRLK